MERLYRIHKQPFPGRIDRRHRKRRINLRITGPDRAGTKRSNSQRKETQDGQEWEKKRQRPRAISPFRLIESHSGACGNILPGPLGEEMFELFFFKMAHSGVLYISERRRGPKRRWAGITYLPLPLILLLDGTESFSGLQIKQRKVVYHSGLWDDSCSLFDGCIRTIRALGVGRTAE